MVLCTPMLSNSWRSMTNEAEPQTWRRGLCVTCLANAVWGSTSLEETAARFGVKLDLSAACVGIQGLHVSGRSCSEVGVEAFS
jgi:hypothetical protein